MQPTNILTKKDVDDRTAGGISYIRTKDNQIKGLAINKQKNPKAPKVITVSNKGKGIMDKAEMLANCNHSFPVYLKLSTNQWIYKGIFNVFKYSHDESHIKKYHGKRKIEEIHGILFLENKSD
jgi:hypothetical protein